MLRPAGHPIEVSRLSRPVSIAFALCAALFSGSAAFAKSGQLDQCWSASDLAYRSGDQLIHKNVAAAIVAPPPMSDVYPHSVAPAQLGAIRRVNLPAGSRKLVAITFDLCEQPHEITGYQGDLVDFLRAEHVKATFFAGGKWLLTHDERAQQLMSDGLFEVGNHSWEHRNLRVISGPVLTREIVAPLRAYQKVRSELAARQCARPGDTVPASERAPKTMALFRFPYGACDEKSLEAVARAGLTPIQWDVSAGDPWPRETASLMRKGVLAHVRPGSIIIFHANGRGWHTGEALPDIVRELKKRGYEFATVSELLRAGEPVIENRCYDLKPGDTDKYDHLGRQVAHLGAGDGAGTKKAAPPFGASPRNAWTSHEEPR